jgi:hypothetical protein
MSNYGFILTRHVNSEKTNKYWNQCVKLIRTYYPLRQIIIIDDNSNQEFVIADHEYKNVTVIQSEYPGRGELLPYIYYLRYKWFPKAIIIHDSLFIHKRIPFETLNMQVLPLWHHIYDKENVNGLLKLASSLKNNHNLLDKINGSTINILGLNKNSFNLCFGGQAFIQLTFLERLQNKYNINALVKVIRNRTDRCAFERIIGLLFCEEYPELINVNSLFGDIMNKYKAFEYNYDEYTVDFQRKKIIYPFIKVWTGR